MSNSDPPPEHYQEMGSSLEQAELEETEKTIRAIDQSTVHRICSGQVVLSLAVAVKELVENSLDAGATSVDVRLKNYGMDLIEVSDNGSGVVEENFTALTLKYHTSKLSDYSDLLGVSSFGFRGEALSSLCALSDLVITTRHKSAKCAMKIEYDNKGNIKNKTPCSRQVGTTVSLTNLFSSLPVRQKEFHKNAKREFTRMTQLLYAYCLISVGVRITCTHQTKTSPKSVVVATQGSTSYRDNIACVFGAKQLQSLLEIKPQVPTIKENIFKGLSTVSQDIGDNIDIEDVDINLSEDSNDADSSNINSSQNDNDVSSCSQTSSRSKGHTNSIPFEFQGFISTCAHGNGRSTTDKQFYFVNSRPCEPTKVIKLVNETYRQFNPHQYPFVFLNLKMEQSGVDINVTPDKRKVFLTKEKVILEVVKASLMKLYESIPSTLKIEFPNSIKLKQNSGKDNADLDQPRIFNSFLKKFASNLKSDSASNDAKETKDESTNGELKRKSTTILDFIGKKTMKLCSNNLPNHHEDLDVTEVLKEESDDLSYVSDSSDGLETKDTVNTEKNTAESIGNKCEENSPKENEEFMFLEYTDNMPNTQIRKVDEVMDEYRIKCKTISSKVSKDVLCDSPKTPTTKISKKIVTDKEDIGKHSRKSIVMKTSLEHVKAHTEIYNTQKKIIGPDRIKFKSTINPVFNKNCEEELQKEIAKDSFKQMEIIGQFNLGFIITRLDDDLFIIDQHATDEIYNFETLQKTTVLTSQKLVLPQQLDMTGVNEQILMDNLPIFTKNGFSFEINEEAPATKRVKLLTIPMSKNWIFGKDDIEELLFMLREAPSEYCRPSRVRAMFASRACRKSVMIGTALAKSDMKKLVEHMSEIDKPWNCPHGRPTIRHLVNLAMVHTE